MTLAFIHSRALLGLRAPAVTVEVHLANGLPSFTLVGLADTEVKESRERVRAALSESGFAFPHNRRITVNLAPADLPKESGRFDLPIAVGILAASGAIHPDRLAHLEFAGELRPWHNQTRSTVSDLSPYDQTLLIDADYFVFNSSLQAIFDTAVDFACYGTAQELGLATSLERTIGNNHKPMYWATVIYFRRTEFSQSVFEFMDYIRQHWEFYCLLYGLANHIYRNDYALSIALQTLSGYSTTNFAPLPGSLVTATEHVNVHKIIGDRVHYSYRTGRGCPWRECHTSKWPGFARHAAGYHTY